ncbi:hypothetical protein JSO55_05760 [Riemerella anatipestifer]
MISDKWPYSRFPHHFGGVFVFSLSLPRGKNKLFMNFISIDFETANTHRYSPCSLGLCIVKDSYIIDRKEWLIQPPRNHYNPRNIEIHGITPEMTANQPEFHELWQEIKPYIHNQTILAHNGNNIDKNILLKTLEYYDIPYSEDDFLIVDTLQLSKRLFHNLKSYTLKDLCDFLSIPFDETHYHNSLYDATKTAELGIKLSEYFALLPDFSVDYNFSKTKSKAKPTKNILLSDIIANKEVRSISSELINPKTDIEDTSHFFYSKKVVITGTFERFPLRDELAKLLYDVGADINRGISSKTDYVIVGANAGWKKLEQIEKLGIEIIDENKFIELFNL